MATLVLSSTTLAENAEAGALVGTLSVSGEVAEGETFRFELNDERFQIINGNQLVVRSGSFDFEGTPTKFTLNIQAFGTHNTPVEAPPVEITLINVNEDPTDIEVTGGSVPDTAIPGTRVAGIKGVDPDKGDALNLSYTIVESMDDPTPISHPYFEIRDGEIVVARELGDEHVGSYSLFVRVTDVGGRSYTKEVTLNVTDANELPEITPDIKEVLEGAPKGTVVATIKVSDPEGLEATAKIYGSSNNYFALVNNNDGTYDIVFQPTNDKIKLNPDIAAHTKVTVTVSDGENSFNEEIDLNINENQEPEPTFEFLEVGRHTPGGTLVGTLMGYDPEGEAVSYILSSESARLFRIVKNEDGTYGVFVKQGITLDYNDEAQRSFSVMVSDGFNVPFEESFDLVFGSYILTSVKEGSGGGTLVGKLMTEDENGNALTYALSEAGSSLFELIPNDDGGYNVVVRNGVILDYENDDHHLLAVNVTSSIGTVAKSLEISLLDVNVSPTATLASVAVNEGAGDGSVVGKLKAVDVENEELVCSLSAESAAWFELMDNGDGDYDIVVRDDVKLDYENPSHHAVNVIVSDGVYSVSRSLSLSLIDGVDTLIGTKTADALTGTAGRDIIKGLAGNDSLVGNTGDDRLYGGAGKDGLTGGAGQDIFVFDSKPNKKTNLDKIADFKVVDDSIWLENKIFTKLGKKGSETAPAQLKKSFFVLGEKAKDKDDYIVYNKKTGKLSFDVDGSGSKAAVEIATLSKKLAMTNKDFFVI